MSPRFQFSLRAFLVAMLVAAAFFGGIHFERERRRREDAKTAKSYSTDEIICVLPPEPTP